MSKSPIVNGLKKYKDEEVISFHMPGHKMNRRRFEKLEELRQNLWEFDNTEVPGLDCLYGSEEIIRESQDNAAKIYRAKKAHFLVNGSTCGIYSMITGLVSKGEKILIQRNCHRSVYTSVILGDLKVDYIDPEIIKGWNIAGAVTVDSVKKAIEENPDTKAIVLTYPTYHGICCDLESISKLTKSKGIKLLVDSAHGAHLGFTDSLPKSALDAGVDVAVASLHKTAPAMTQTSLLLESESLGASRIETMLEIYQSTSPSYILMASIEQAVEIMNESGCELLEDLKLYIDEFIEESDSLNIKVLKKEDLNPEFSLDWTKLNILSSLQGDILSERLRENKIQSEMSQANVVTLLTSIGNQREDFEKLMLALSKIELKSDLKLEDITLLSKAIIKMSPREAFYTKGKKVLLEDSLGKISLEMVCPYPPGIPILMAGEEITSELLILIKKMKNGNIRINGPEDKELKYIRVAE